jgi:hypothetical protein
MGQLRSSVGEATLVQSSPSEQRPTIARPVARSDVVEPVAGAFRLVAESRDSSRTL